MAERFFATLEGDLADHTDFATRAETRAAIFENIEAFYRRQRRPPYLGYQAPAEFEEKRTSRSRKQQNNLCPQKRGHLDSRRTRGYGRVSKPRPRKPGAPVAPPLSTPRTESGLRSAFQRALKRAQVTHPHLHGPRHFYVTAGFVGGASAPTVQKLAGHSHLSVTQRYAHTNETALRHAPERESTSTAVTERERGW